MRKRLSCSRLDLLHAIGKSSDYFGRRIATPGNNPNCALGCILQTQNFEVLVKEKARRQVRN